jgi:ubiquinone/menaquinone biosynthesis C-methylase UbiE
MARYVAFEFPAVLPMMEHCSEDLHHLQPRLEGLSLDFSCGRRMYDLIAWAYDAGQRLLPVWRRYIGAALPEFEGCERILEVGPGPGVLLEQIAAAGPRPIGVDVSRSMLRRARRRLEHAGRHVALVQADALRLPFGAAAFDAVVMTFALSAVPEGDGAVAEVSRVLRPGGKFVVVDACLPSDGNLWGTALTRLWTKMGSHLHDEVRLMRKHGLALENRREFGVFDAIQIVVGRKPSGLARSGRSG